jgi:hypothetical protein
MTTHALPLRLLPLLLAAAALTLAASLSPRAARAQAGDEAESATVEVSPLLAEAIEASATPGPWAADAPVRTTASGYTFRDVRVAALWGLYQARQEGDISRPAFQDNLERLGRRHFGDSFAYYLLIPRDPLFAPPPSPARFELAFEGFERARTSPFGLAFAQGYLPFGTGLAATFYRPNAGVGPVMPFGGPFRFGPFFYGGLGYGQAFGFFLPAFAGSPFAGSPFAWSPFAGSPFVGTPFGAPFGVPCPPSGATPPRVPVATTGGTPAPPPQAPPTADRRSKADREAQAADRRTEHTPPPRAERLELAQSLRPSIIERARKADIVRTLDPAFRPPEPQRGFRFFPLPRPTYDDATGRRRVRTGTYGRAARPHRARRRVRRSSRSSSRAASVSRSRRTGGSKKAPARRRAPARKGGG